MTRIVHPVWFSPEAKVTAAMIAGDTAPGVPRACVTVSDTERTWLLEFPDRHQAVAMLAKAAADLLDLQADLRRVPPPIDLDALRRVRLDGDRR